MADLARRATQNATQAHLDIMSFTLHQLARGEQRARLPRRQTCNAAGGANPSRITATIPRASLQSVFTGIALGCSALRVRRT
jgi:hypothetical protein